MKTSKQALACTVILWVSIFTPGAAAGSMVSTRQAATQKHRVPKQSLHFALPGLKKTDVTVTAVPGAHGALKGFQFVSKLQGQEYVAFLPADESLELDRDDTSLQKLDHYYFRLSLPESAHAELDGSLDNESYVVRLSHPAGSARADDFTLETQTSWFYIIESAGDKLNDAPLHARGAGDHVWDLERALASRPTQLSLPHASGKRASSRSCLAKSCPKAKARASADRPA